ncbi:MAG TPA: hypothetical protein ENJ79_09790 [Gammaproteobacteria bacterium]|nr:hypothetical protein [Gammaproteobacteria bacterium]
MHSQQITAQVDTSKNAFKTLRRHRKLRGLLYPDRKRAPGHRKVPVLVRLDPLPGLTPSDKPPVRIFVGTESPQYRAERVLVWSIMQVRDPSRIYEIYLMKDLEGFNRSTWKTGFTNYRYAIPELAGKRGRAIYNDADQIYFTDPAKLFDSDMGGMGVLGITEKETSVMLLDCEKLADIWTIEDAKEIHSHKYFRKKVHDVGLWGLMPPTWNSRDHEYVEGESNLLHYTILHTQPWRPYPKVLKYRPNKLAYLWEELERGADQARFTLFTEKNPSDRYLELLDMYAHMHEVGRPDMGRSAEETFSGISLFEHIEPIAHLVRRTGARSILDFGSGKAKHYHDAPDYPAGSRFKTLPAWNNALVTCYDPGYKPFSGELESSLYDGVISTDVLEHIPEEDIGWVLDKLFRYAGKFVYVVAACYPAKKILPDGSNAHCTIQPPEWWQGQMEMAARRNRGVTWVLCTQEKSALSFKQRKRLKKKGILSRYFSGDGDGSREYWSPSKIPTRQA